MVGKERCYSGDGSGLVCEQKYLQVPRKFIHNEQVTVKVIFTSDERISLVFNCCLSSNKTIIHVETPPCSVA